MTVSEVLKKYGEISDRTDCGYYIYCDDCPLHDWALSDEYCPELGSGGEDCAARILDYLEDSAKLNNTIKDSGERTVFETGAKRDMHTGKGRMDLLPWYAIIEVAKHCENGALKYGERNVDKGIPLHSLLDSGARHLAKVIAGESDEDHLRAACWNLLWALNQRTTHPQLNDMPWADKEENDD